MFLLCLSRRKTKKLGVGRAMGRGGETCQVIRERQRTYVHKLKMHQLNCLAMT